jgi:hypothetical protein
MLREKISKNCSFVRYQGPIAGLAGQALSRAIDNNSPNTPAA